MRDFCSKFVAKKYNISILKSPTNIVELYRNTSQFPTTSPILYERPAYCNWLIQVSALKLVGKLKGLIGWVPILR